MSAASEYCRSVLRVSVAQICQNLGWNATQTSTLELLTDVLERYLLELGKVSHRYCEQFGRTQPNLDDLGLAFRHMGINLGELEDYVHHVDPVPFAHEVVAFPAPKTNNLRFPNPRSREILQHREEHVHEHLPYMFSGMEDEVTEEPAASPPPPSQPPPLLESSPMDATSPAGEKRAATGSVEGPPTKRTRIMASYLPEEAGHSLYEMTSVCMTSGGFLTPMRNQGRLPDSRTPPPPIRQTLAEAQTASNKVDGSEANKENNILDPSRNEPTMRVSISTSKDGTLTITSEGVNSSSSSSCKKPEPVKIKSKKKIDAKPKKLKAVPSSAEIPSQVGVPHPATSFPKKSKYLVHKNGKPKIVKGKDMKSKEEKLKEKKSKEEKLKERKLKQAELKDGKLLKIKKIRTKDGVKKKSAAQDTSLLTETGSHSQLKELETGSQSRLKELLLSPDKLASKQSPNNIPDISFQKEKNIIVALSPNSNEGIMQAFPPTDIFEMPSSRENSPERLVIAEAEGRAREKEEERLARLKNINDSIDAVIRDSVAALDQQEQGLMNSALQKSLPAKGEKLSPTKGEKKAPRPKKAKAKGKFKSSEFIADEVIKQEMADDTTAAMNKSIYETIDAVIRGDNLTTSNSVEDVPVISVSAGLGNSAMVHSTEKKAGKDVSGKTTSSLPGGSVVLHTSSTTDKKAGKKIKKKLDKDKSPRVKKKVSSKLQTKTVKTEATVPPLEQKLFVSDKYSSEEMRIYEFAESPPHMPSRRPSQAAPSPPLPSSSPALVPQVVSSPIDVKPQISSLIPETAVESLPILSPSMDQPPLKPFKIEISREKEKHKDRDKNRVKSREKSREDKEHRKERKEKKRDKEKKKKNRDRDRDRHEKRHEHKEEKNKEDKPGSGEMSGFKIKIKIGGTTSNSPSVMVTDNKTSPVDTSLKHETSMSPLQRPEIPKLVIRRDSSDTSSQKKMGLKHMTKMMTSASLPTIKSEPLEPSSPTNPPTELSPPTLNLVQSPSVSRRSTSPRSSPLCSPSALFQENRSPMRISFSKRGRSPVKAPRSLLASPPPSSLVSPHHSSPVPDKRPFSHWHSPGHSPLPHTPSPPPKSPSSMPKTPSPCRQHQPSSPMSVSSPLQRSPSPSHKSPTPTPKTPSLSPAYPPTSPVHSEHSPSRDKSPSPVINPIFGTPEHKNSHPPSPLFSNVVSEDIKPELERMLEQESVPLTTPVKHKGKVGRPRSKSPRTGSPKRKSPKGIKSPKIVKSPKRIKSPKSIKSPKGGLQKANKPSKGKTGKSPGRPPKAKVTAALAEMITSVDTSKIEISPPKIKPPTPVPVKSEPFEDEKSLPSSPASPSAQSVSGDKSKSTFATSQSRQRTVEAETVGFFIDATGQKIWICPACKMQDDGSPMIGCDKCDDWYHWVCVNIVQEPPEEQSWFCPRCSAKVRGKPKALKPKGKRGRKKKVQ